MNKRIKKKQIKMNNKKLCKRYPFLIPRNRWTDKLIWDKTDKYSMPYSYTELDAMPDGWRRAFGIEMCEEIREELIKYNYLDKYRIADIKEKFGELRWYDNGAPVGCAEKIWKIIDKYTELSHHTCMICGKPTETSSDGYWLYTLCNKCKEKINRR